MADLESTVINTSVTQKDPKEALVIAVTTRAIFNLEKEHEIFLTKGKEEYVKHQQTNENNPLEPGTAFAFIQAAQFVNKKLLERDPEEKELFDVIVLSNNSPESGVRIINSAKQHGVSAALIFQQEIQAPSTQLRVVFDGDAVLFSDETERVFREKGLEGAVEYEKKMESVPMGEGPLKAFALHLGKMRQKFGTEDSPIRIYLVTARSGRDMGIRAIKTLREWGLAIDEAFFMDGAPKGPILSKIQPHIFFDDGLHNIQGAQDVGIPSALVPCD
ncbi:cytosolic 5'-nucleotidase 1A [Zootoca vivipara]|uniref:cytosolic 5'-nucleotidase 1A n=1 Tax=Zootoca vivipara TaxID=8524 RepID=UPI00293C0364|nr:cytosolic 5'-nucleotidase 1A [Zootoca vivipara]